MNRNELQDAIFDMVRFFAFAFVFMILFAFCCFPLWLPWVVQHVSIQVR